MGLATAIAPANPTSARAIPDTVREFPPISGDMLYEVINGEIVEKTLGAKQTVIAATLDQILGAFARSRRLGRVFPEMIFRIDLEKNLQRRLDVAFISDARWPFRKTIPDVGAWNIAPDLAVEVVSPSDKAYEIQDKIQDYFATGVREMWIIYPNVRLLHRLQSPTEIEVLQAGQELDGGTLLPGFRMQLSELFEDDPE